MEPLSFMIKKIILIIIYLLVCSCSSCEDASITQPPTSIIGCMDPEACNYNPDASDAGECDYIDCNDHPINSLWFMPNSDGTWGIGYNSNVQIGGFQFDVEDAIIISASGGISSDNNFMVSASGNTILGFSLSLFLLLR